MKRLTIVLIAGVLLTVATAAATGEFTVFSASSEMLRAWRPGYDEPIAEIPLDFGTDVPGLAYDGENFWIIDGREDRIYCFDNNGDLVTNFPSPGPDPVAITFDGEYLWVSCDLHGYYDDVMIYSVTLEGDAGPYPPFEGEGDAGLAYCNSFGGSIVTLNLAFLTIYYDKYGNQLLEDFLTPEYGGSTWAYGLESEGEYLWANLYADTWHEARIYKFKGGYPIEGEGGWPGFETNLSCGNWTDDSIKPESLGKIKYFFK